MTSIWWRCWKNPPQIIEYICKEIIHEYPRNILDVWCWDGRNSFYMANLWHNVLCVDRNSESIQNLDHEAKEIGLNAYIQTQVANITTYKPDKCFDVILLSFVLHFIEESVFEQTVDALYSWLTPRWIIIIGDFYGDGPIKNPEKYHSFTEENIENLIRNDTKMIFLKKEKMRTYAGDMHSGFWLLLEKRE